MDVDNPASGRDDDPTLFDCLTNANGEVGIWAEIPYQIDLPPDFVEQHIGLLQTGLHSVCVPGGRAVRIPNSPLPDQIVYPNNANLELILQAQQPPNEEEAEDGGLGFGNRTVLVVRVSGTNETPVESIQDLAGAIFGLGSQPLVNHMRAQFNRCSFSKLDFVAAPAAFSGLNESVLDNGVADVQLGYRLQGSSVFRVLNDASESVATMLGVDSLRQHFRHVVFCVARGTIYTNNDPDWLAFATLRGERSTFNSNRCTSLSFLMHEIGHNLGLVHSADDIIRGAYGDTTGMVRTYVPVLRVAWDLFVSHTNQCFPLHWFLLF